MKKLSHKQFLATFKYAPRPAINLLASNAKGEIILTKRNIPPFEGSWHIPGTILRKGETIETALKRICQDELGIKLDVKNAKLLGVFEDIDKDPRGHIIDIVYGVQIDEKIEFKPNEQSAEIKFFKKLPSKGGFNHRQTLNSLGYK